MTFEQYKKNALKSFNKAVKEGLVDEDILEELEEFNKLNDYYTTSSCSGRILLLKNPASDKKMPNAFYYKTHKRASSEVITRKVKEYDDDFELWFKLEPYILHIGCIDLKSARKLLKLCKEKGIKRAGINAWSKRIIVEVIGTENVESLVYKNRILVSDEYLKVLTNKANQRLKHAKRVLHDFLKETKNL